MFKINYFLSFTYDLLIRIITIMSIKLLKKIYNL